MHERQDEETRYKGQEMNDLESITTTSESTFKFSYRCVLYSPQATAIARFDTQLCSSYRD